MTDISTDAATLRAALAALGPGRVWRPVPGPDGTLLAPGRGPGPECLDAYVAGLDVAGKTVADLGCNLGYFAFLAARCLLGLPISFPGTTGVLEPMTGGRIVEPGEA